MSQPAVRLTPGQYEALCRLGTSRRFCSGTFILREGDRSEHVVLIVRGVAKVCATASSGYLTVLAIRSAGEIVGEFSSFDHKPHSASVVAATEVQSVIITGERFRRYLVSEPRLALSLLTCLVGRVRESDRRRMEFGSLDVTSRLARLLLELADRAGRVNLSQTELAGAIGSSREAVARSLRTLRSSGAITTGRLAVAVLDRSVLQEFGNGHPAGD